jgi:formylmethanofuran dehydrogenase subunit C
MTFDEPGKMIEDAKRAWIESALKDSNEGDSAMVATRVADMSVDELKSLIQETVTQTLLELFRDPDAGLELHEDFKSLLQHSLAAVKAGGETMTADNVAAKLGLSW